MLVVIGGAFFLLIVMTVFRDAVARNVLRVFGIDGGLIPIVAGVMGLGIAIGFYIMWRVGFRV